MNFGQGSVSRTNKINSGAPFPAGSANNGLSVDTTSGKIVLGNDVNDPLKPAMLLSDREIFMNALRILFKEATASTVVNGGRVNCDGDESQGIFGQFLATDVNLANRSFSLLMSQTEQCGMVPFFNGANNFNMFMNVARAVFGTGLSFPAQIGAAALQVEGSLATADPGSGRTDWKLGTKVAQAVALDAAHYVEVMIGGVVVKLGVVT